MHPQQLRKKASRPISSSFTNRTPRHPKSYLKTRIRGSRLRNAARLLALVELTRRLHQACEHAYDKQAADRLLPQNPVAPKIPVPSGELAKIRDDVEKAIAAKRCADYLKELLDEASIQTGEPYRDIMVTFDNITFMYQADGGFALGSFENGTAAATIRPFESNFISEDRSAFIRLQTAQNFLGETLHHVGTHGAYRDAPLANALNTILVRKGLEKPQTFTERNYSEVTTASNYWHQEFLLFAG
jgi:hypothetical protein